MSFAPVKASPIHSTVKHSLWVAREWQWCWTRRPSESSSCHLQKFVCIHLQKITIAGLVVCWHSLIEGQGAGRWILPDPLASLPVFYSSTLIASKFSVLGKGLVHIDWGRLRGGISVLLWESCYPWWVKIAAVQLLWWAVLLLSVAAHPCSVFKPRKLTGSPVGVDRIELWFAIGILQRHGGVFPNPLAGTEFSQPVPMTEVLTVEMFVITHSAYKGCVFV